MLGGPILCGTGIVKGYIIAESGSMALRRACLQVLSHWERRMHPGHGVATTPGNPVKLLAFRNVLSTGDHFAIQSKGVFGSRDLQTRFDGACEENSDEDKATMKNSSDAAGDIAPHCIDSELEAVSDMEISEGNNKSKSLQFNALSAMKSSKRHNLAMIYTCKVCETRSVKTMRRESYEKGVVIVRCSGCNNLHLIADRLGWFGEPSSVEDFLRANGEEVRRGSQDSYELTLEDLAGWRSK